jgi:hypothetical protein
LGPLKAESIQDLAQVDYLEAQFCPALPKINPPRDRGLGHLSKDLGPTDRAGPREPSAPPCFIGGTKQVSVQ